jgi:hypothetical protein
MDFDRQGISTNAAGNHLAKIVIWCKVRPPESNVDVIWKSRKSFQGWQPLDYVKVNTLLVL